MCYDVKNGKQQYDIAAYPRTEQEKFQNTSLILRGKNGFYQLRNGSKGGFFHFDLHKRAWEKLMETEYTLNTLMISADEKAYISCIRGFWIIDPEKRTRHYMPTLRTRKGNVLATEISTIFQDRQGALWLGTFNRGLLYYHPALYKHIHIDKKDFPLSLERNTAVANFTEARDGNIFIKDRTAIYKLDLQEDGNRILIPVEASTLPKELQGEYGSEAAFVSHDGTLYFGDADGCNIFSPNPEPPSSSLPYPPVFTAIHVHGECILPGSLSLCERNIIEPQPELPYSRVLRIELLQPRAHPLPLSAGRYRRTMGNRRQHEAEQRHSPSSLYQLATGKLHLQGNGL